MKVWSRWMRGRFWILIDEISRTWRGKDQSEGKVKITLVSDLAVIIDNIMP